MSPESCQHFLLRKDGKPKAKTNNLIAKTLPYRRKEKKRAATDQKNSPSQRSGADALEPASRNPGPRSRGQAAHQPLLQTRIWKPLLDTVTFPECKVQTGARDNPSSLEVFFPAAWVELGDIPLVTRGEAKTQRSYHLPAVAEAGEFRSWGSPRTADAQVHFPTVTFSRSDSDKDFDTHTGLLERSYFMKRLVFF